MDRICAISITRLVYNTRVELAHFTEYAGISAILGVLEANVSIVCACLPTIPPFLAFIADRIRSLNVGLTGLLDGFSRDRRTRRHAEGSFKLSSLHDKRRSGGLSMDDNNDGAKLREHGQVAYPLGVPTRARVDGFEKNQWTGEASPSGAHVGQAWEPRDLETGDRPQRNINVTKTWVVD